MVDLNLVVAVGGVVLLIFFAVLIGTSMDTESQRVQARNTAAERRELADERRGLEAVQRSLVDERYRLAEERRELAAGCPRPDCPRRGRTR
jgi:hypothetical protein